MAAPTPLETVQALMAALESGWPSRDTARLASLLGEGVVYHNMPLEPIVGREAVLAALAGYMDRGDQVDVDITHILAGDSIVMTERVDRLVSSDHTISLRVMGVFEVRAGLITAWRDYFDLNEFASQVPDGA